MSLPSQLQPRPPRWRPLKYFCAEPPQYGLNVSSSEYTDHNSGGLRLLRTTDINDDGSLSLGNEVYINAESLISNYRLTAGDLLLSRSGTLGRSFLCTPSSPPSTFAGYLIRFRPRQNVDPRYLNYCSRATFFTDGIKANAVASTIANFNAERYGALQLPWHPLPEQRAIADCLDTETARIDTLISKKRHLIDLLAERRTALITETVTRGLNPSPRLHPSNIDWLGEIPEHWEVRRLKYRASYRTSNVDKKTKEGEIRVRLCNYTDVYYGERIRAGDGTFMKATASPQELARFRLNEGDIVITKDSEDWQDIAVPAFIEETADDFVCGYHLGIIRSNPFADPGFVFRAMQSVAVNRQLQVAASGVTRFGLPQSAVGEALVPFPPLEEQRAIAAFLERQTDCTDALSARMEAVIELLEEYRAALITAAVTGQISVGS